MGKRSYNNLFNQIMERILAYDGHVYFVTLTCKDDREVNRFSILNFFHKLRYREVEVAGYMWVKELQKRGVIHYHMIILTPHKIVDFYSRVSESWKYGYVFVRGVEKNKVRQALLYIMKYIKKQLGDYGVDNEKMRRKIGRGGILRFRVVSLYERVSAFSEFEYVGGLAYRGARVKFYRAGDLVMVVRLFGLRSGIDIFKIDSENVISKYKYRPKWNFLAKIMNEIQYSFLNSDERRDIIGYHDFDREINAVLKTC